MKAFGTSCEGLVWKDNMNFETNSQMVGYKLKKFAPLGVKEKHHVVEKKR